MSLFLPRFVYPVSMIATAFSLLLPMETEEAQIARGLRRRDPDLLDALIEQYQHRLLRYLLHLTGNRAVAEDLFQEVWVRVLEKGHLYDGRNRFVTWLMSIAHNVAIDYLRKRSPASLDEMQDPGGRRALRAAGDRPVALRTGGGPAAAGEICTKRCSACRRCFARCWCCAFRSR